MIGKGGVNISEAEAMNHIGGYCLALDMTGTEFLVKARQSNQPWCLGKSFGTATPVSRLINKEEVLDPHNLRVWSKLNGGMKQDDTTAGFIFDVKNRNFSEYWLIINLFLFRFQKWFRTFLSTLLCKKMIWYWQGLPWALVQLKKTILLNADSVILSKWNLQLKGSLRRIFGICIR